MRAADYFHTAAARYPDREYIIHKNKRLTYRQCEELIDQLAHALKADTRIKPGSHVAIYSENQYLVPLLQFAVNQSDHARICVHDRNAPETNAQVLHYLDCDVVFFSRKYAESVASIKPALPQVHTYICIDGDSPEGESLASWLEDKPKGPFPYEPEDLNATAFLIPTGGTTGPSKGVVHSHRSLEMEIINQVVSFKMNEGSRLLSYAPLSHAAGQFAFGLLPFGGTLVVMDGFDPVELLRIIEAERITHTFFPPTVLTALLAHPQTNKTDFSSLKCGLVGSAPIAPERFKEAVRVIGPSLIEGFGQSETLQPLIVKTASDYLKPDGSFDEAVVASAGRAVPFMRVEIMDDEGRLLPPGQRGEIVVRGSMGMSGYYKMPEATEETSKFGWHHTGDVGVMDERGFITIVDRKKDMIITGGFNVFPAEVEHVINEHPAVLECLVIGVPDEKWGEAVKALVTLKAGAVLQEDDLLGYCKTRLGSVKCPKSVEFRPHLPRSAVGKLLRREARAPYWQGQWRTV